jgi:hypothetical protein
VCSTNDKHGKNTKFSSEKLKEKGYVETVAVDGRAILKRVLKK